MSERIRNLENSYKGNYKYFYCFFSRLNNHHTAYVVEHLVDYEHVKLVTFLIQVLNSWNVVHISGNHGEDGSEGTQHVELIVHVGESVHVLRVDVGQAVGEVGDVRVVVVRWVVAEDGHLRTRSEALQD